MLNKHEQQIFSPELNKPINATHGRFISNTSFVQHRSPVKSDSVYMYMTQTGEEF